MIVRSSSKWLKHQHQYSHHQQNIHPHHNYHHEHHHHHLHTAITITTPVVSSHISYSSLLGWTTGDMNLVTRRELMNGWVSTAFVFLHLILLLCLSFSQIVPQVCSKVPHGGRIKKDCIPKVAKNWSKTTKYDIFLHREKPPIGTSTWWITGTLRWVFSSPMTPISSL